MAIAGVLVILTVLFFLLIFAIGIASCVFWIWMIIDCATKETDENNNRVLWVLIIVFVHVLGALLYLLIRRPQRLAELGR